MRKPYATPLMAWSDLNHSKEHTETVSLCIPNRMFISVKGLPVCKLGMGLIGLWVCIVRLPIAGWDIPGDLGG